MKSQLGEISATPSKRIYLSIVADYHLYLSLCELIDNAIDNWIFNGRNGDVKIELDIDYDQQSISVEDNSGGIKEENLGLIVGPGHSRESSTDEIIGVFGVGAKRGVVALAEQIKIITRFQDKKTIQVEFDNDWIEEEGNWKLPYHEANPIAENTTIIRLSNLRERLDDEQHETLIEHFSAAYALFIKSGNVKILVNGQEVPSKTFENWSYPPGFEPIEATGPIKFRDGETVQVSITAGLTKSHKNTEDGNEEYGAYFYFNNRLVSRAYKGNEVGFNKPFKIGKPHPKLSLARVIVKLSGPVILMPWNSSKSRVDFKHKTYYEIAEHIERMFVTYGTMSKNWESAWPEEVFKYDSGKITKESLKEISSEVRIRVPVIKRSPRKVKYIDLIKNLNKELTVDKPWLKGHYEAIVAVNEISKMDLVQATEICLQILDSTLEIAFKNYLVYESGTPFGDQRLENIMKDRSAVHREIKNFIKFKKGTWPKVEFFYHLRCDLVHKRNSAPVDPDNLENFRKLVEYMLKKMFRLKFAK